MNEQEQKPRKRRNRNLKFVTRIQENAKNTKLPNTVSVELTYQQALSIHLRSRQLVRESFFHPHLIDERTKSNQIDVCYAQRNRQLSYN